jgi:hypothetical protein
MILFRHFFAITKKSAKPLLGERELRERGDGEV